MQSNAQHTQLAIINRQYIGFYFYSFHVFVSRSKYIWILYECHVILFSGWSGNIWVINWTICVTFLFILTSLLYLLLNGLYFLLMWIVSSFNFVESFCLINVNQILWSYRFKRLNVGLVLFGFFTYFKEDIS